MVSGTSNSTSPRVSNSVSSPISSEKLAVSSTGSSRMISKGIKPSMMISSPCNRQLSSQAGTALLAPDSNSALPSSSRSICGRIWTTGPSASSGGAVGGKPGGRRSGRIPPGTAGGTAPRCRLPTASPGKGVATGRSARGMTSAGTGGSSTGGDGVGGAGTGGASCRGGACTGRACTGGGGGGPAALSADGGRRKSLAGFHRTGDIIPVASSLFVLPGQSLRGDVLGYSSGCSEHGQMRGRFTGTEEQFWQSGRPHQPTSRYIPQKSPRPGTPIRPPRDQERSPGSRRKKAVIVERPGWTTEPNRLEFRASRGSPRESGV